MLCVKRESLLLPATLDSDLNWQEQIAQAKNLTEQNIPFIWHFDFGFDQHVDPTFALQSYKLAVEQFSQQIFPHFPAPISLYCGEAYTVPISNDQEDFLEWLKEINRAESCETKQVFAMDRFADYLQRIGSFFPLDAKLMVTLLGRPHPSLALCAQILSSARFGHLDLQTPDLPFTLRGIETEQEQSSFALCLPQDTQITPETLEQIDQLLSKVERENLSISIAPEELLHQVWQGIDVLLVDEEWLSLQGKRRVCGFEATGGEVLSPDEFLKRKSE